MLNEGIRLTVTNQYKTMNGLTPDSHAYHHLLVEAIVQHQAVSQRQAVGLHRVAST